MKDANGMEHSSENGQFVSKGAAKNSNESKKANAERVYNTNDERDYIPRSGKRDEKSWNYPEVKQRIDDLEESLQKARSQNKILAIKKATKAQEIIITQEIENIDKGIETIGNRNDLMTQRRRLRQLLLKIDQKGKSLLGF